MSDTLLTNSKDRTKVRKIIHIDMDAFYASIEQRDHPEFKGRPVVVGGDPNARGVIASASYEARKFGIRSAMPSSTAVQLCRDLVFVQPHFEKYSEASEKMREIFETITPLIEPLSLDEAYLDVTENLLNEPLAMKIAAHIKKQIFQELKVTASAGVGPNKFIAKLASELRKPDGLVVVPPERVFALIENLAVEKFWGVGPVTAKKLNDAGFITAADIRKRTVEELEKCVGSYAEFLFGLAHGEDDREVDTSSEPKSRGAETTFDHDILNPHTLLPIIEEMAQEIVQDLKPLQYLARTITLKLRYADFRTITRSRTLLHPTIDSRLIAQTAADLMYKDTEVGKTPIRLIGVAVSGFTHPEHPLQLWFKFFEEMHSENKLRGTR